MNKTKLKVKKLKTKVKIENKQSNRDHLAHFLSLEKQFFKDDTL